jgi:hypothetical protein
MAVILLGGLVLRRDLSRPAAALDAVYATLIPLRILKIITAD